MINQVDWLVLWVNHELNNFNNNSTKAEEQISKLVDLFKVGDSTSLWES